MANSTEIPRISYAITDSILNSNGNHYNFAIPFAFENTEDIKVILDNGNFITNFTTRFNNNNADSGSVNILKEELTNAKNIYIYRHMAFIRETEFQADSDFRAVIINGEFDRIMWLLQQMDMQVAGTIHRPQYDTGPDLILPDTKDRKNKLLAFDNNGVPIVIDDSQASAANAITTAAEAALSANRSATSAIEAKAEAISIKNIINNIDNYIIKDGSIINDKLADKTITNAKLTDSMVGKQSIYMPAGAMIPIKTNGAKSKIIHLENNTKSITILEFSGSLDNKAQFSIAMPKSWDAGAVQFQLYWLCDYAGNSGYVVFRIAGCCISDRTSFSQSFGQAKKITALASTTKNDLLKTGISEKLTLNNAAANKLAFFQIWRDVNDQADTIPIDAKLIGINLTYTTKKPTDN